MHDHHHAALEHEGELSSGLAEEAIALTAGLLDDAGPEVRRILDLGCGPGVGTAALAEAFPDATVVAVDESAVMLGRAVARVAGLGYAARVETHQLDLNGDLSSLGRCDLAWAAMSIHHANDEVSTLRAVRSLIVPLGLLCVLERAEPMFVRFADELGRTGIWDRLEEARRRWFEHKRDRLPGAMKADAYPSMLAAAGLEVIIDRPLTGTVEVPRAMQKFVIGVLRGSLTDLSSFADEADLEALRRLLAEASLSPERFNAVQVTTSRKLFVARSAS